MQHIYKMPLPAEDCNASRHVSSPCVRVWTQIGVGSVAAAGSLSPCQCYAWASGQPQSCSLAYLQVALQDFRLCIDPAAEPLTQGERNTTQPSPLPSLLMHSALQPSSWKARTKEGRREWVLRVGLLVGRHRAQGLHGGRARRHVCPCGHAGWGLYDCPIQSGKPVEASRACIMT